MISLVMSSGPTARTNRSGYVRPMADIRMFRATFETHLVRSPEEVWAFLVDLPETPRWRSHLRSVGWIDGGDTRVGRRFAVESSFAGWRNLAMQGEVTAYEPLERFSYRITEGPVHAENEYRLRPDGDGGTIFTMIGSAGMPGTVMRLVGPLIARAYSRATRRELRRLGEILA